MRSAAILAGGLASRFGGCDKGALNVDGRTILSRQLDALSEIADILIVGGREAHPGTRAIADLVPGSGPLGGLHAALSEARGDSAFVLACDMPYVTAGVVNYLYALAGRDGWDVVVPWTERAHPLCAVYSRACLEPITRRLAERTLRLVDLIDDLNGRGRVRRVGADELERFGDPPRLLANVNTPADYHKLQS